MLETLPTLPATLHTRWRSIVLWSLVVTVVAACVTLLLHNRYTASAVVLPPDNQSDLMSEMSSVPGMLALSRLMGMNAGQGTDLYIGVMRSGRVAGHLVDRFHLVQQYGVKDAEKAARELAQHTSLSTTNEGLVRVAVTERDRRSEE